MLREPARFRFWGIRDGRRVYAEQIGSDLILDPEIPSIRQAEDVIAALQEAVDEVIDFWGDTCWSIGGGERRLMPADWPSDEEMAEDAEERNAAKALWPAPVRHTIEEGKRSLAFSRKVGPADISDEEAEAIVRERYDLELAIRAKVWDGEMLREQAEEEFVEENQGPPWHWATIQEILDHGAPRPSTERFAVPTEVLKCRDCLRPCEWIWYACFPGPMTGSAGWVAICTDCRTWHKEWRRVVS